MSPDADDLLENDKQKLQRAWRNYQSSDSWKDSLNPAQVIEQVCWGLSFISILSMLVTMPWVGQDKAIPGTMWLGIPLTLCILFGLSAITVRMARAGFRDADRTVSQKFERGR